jgi:hypothetical protein
MSSACSARHAMSAALSGRLSPRGDLPRSPGTTQATRIATGWEVAPADGGHAIWLLSFKDARHCTLSKIGLDGRTRQRARPVSCSAQLIDAGSGVVLVHGRTVVDPVTARTL